MYMLTNHLPVVINSGENMVKQMKNVPYHKKLQVDTKIIWCIESRYIILFND
jgi:hypothetical protein